MRQFRKLSSLAGIVAGALVLAACSSGGAPDGGANGDAPEVKPLSIHANSTNTYQKNFNPFSPSLLHGTRSFIYEPLIINTPMRPDESIPWLAESMKFNDDGSMVTFTLRDGVKWSDGEAFDADDVAFTFNMMAKNPATNAGALPIVGAEATDKLTVEVTFEKSQFAYEFAVGNTNIVPEHIWSKIDNPVETTNEEPVGTGPFLLDKFGPQLYTLIKNQEYWNADEIEVQEIHYPANTTETFNTALQTGAIDWSGGFVPNVDQIFVDHDPENRGYWYPGGGIVNLTVNSEKEVFADVELREAMTIGLDRKQIVDTAMQGYTMPAHPTGLPKPAYESVISDEYRDLNFDYDPDAANKILDDAGYKPGSDGIRVSPAGERLSWPLEIPSSYADWIDVSQLLAEQYAKIGIEIVPQGVSFESWIASRGSGDFTVTITSVNIGQTPFDMYKSMMSSEYSVDSGPVISNFGRFYNDDADAALAAYASTADKAAQQEALDNLQKIMVEEVPTIPMFQSPNWFQSNTERWEGFPSEEDPYAFGAPYQSPDILLVIQNLTPAK